VLEIPVLSLHHEEIALELKGVMDNLTGTEESAERGKALVYAESSFQSSIGRGPEG
jgi:hypothetical protein